MCEICKMSPCASGCPNEPEPPICGQCEWCGEPIYEGDTYYDVQHSIYCEQCVDDDCKEIMQKHGLLIDWIAEVDR